VKRDGAESPPLLHDGVGKLHRQVLRITGALLDAPRLPRSEPTDLSTLLGQGVATIGRRSMVVVVSDFISRPGWERPLSMLARRHEVLAIRVHDPREASLPDVGPLVMQDAETGEQVWVDTRDRGFRSSFEAAARERETALAQLFRRAGVLAYPLSTDDDLVGAIVRIARQRARRRR